MIYVLPNKKLYLFLFLKGQASDWMRNRFKEGINEGGEETGGSEKGESETRRGEIYHISLLIILFFSRFFFDLR